MNGMVCVCVLTGRGSETSRRRPSVGFRFFGFRVAAVVEGLDGRRHWRCARPPRSTATPSTPLRLLTVTSRLGRKVLPGFISPWTDFGRLLPGFYRVFFLYRLLRTWNGSSWAIPGYNGLYWVVLGCKGGYRVFTGFLLAFKLGQPGNGSEKSRRRHETERKTSAETKKATP